MSEPQFFQTRMGQRFYEHTVPELVRALERLSENLERLVPRAENPRQHAVEPSPDSPDDQR